MVMLNYVGKKKHRKNRRLYMYKRSMRIFKKINEQYRQVLNYFNYTGNIFLLHRQYVFIPYVVDFYYIGNRFLLHRQYIFIT